MLGMKGNNHEEANKQKETEEEKESVSNRNTILKEK